MNIYEQNKAFCKAKAPGLYRYLYELPPRETALRVEKTPQGLKVMNAVVECYLCSVYDTARELQETFADVAADTEIIIFSGCLTESLPRYLKKNFRNLRYVFIIDPTNQILQAALGECLLSRAAAAVKPANFNVVPNIAVGELIEYIFKEIKFSDKLAVVFSVAYRTLFPAYYQDFARKCGDYLRVMLLNFSTNNLYMIPWIKNTMRNYTERVIDARTLLPFIAGKSIIIVSAGPSLKKNVQLLRGAAEKAVIIAVGSSVPILNELGIRPHFNVGVDSIQGTTFHNLRYPDIPLLFGNKIQHETLARYEGERVCFIGASDYLDIYLWEDDYDRELFVDTGMSVTTSVLSLVCKMGAKQVIFIGQDMCFYENKVHLIEQAGDAKVIQFDKMYRSDIYGNTVETAQGFWAIKEFLEAVIIKHPEIEFINATEGGLGVDGAVNARLEDTLATVPAAVHSLQEEIKQLLGNADTVCFMDKMQEKDVLSDTQKIHAICMNILEIIQRIGYLQKNKAQPKKIDKELAMMKKQIAKLCANKLYPMLNLHLSSAFKLATARYEGDLASKDWTRRVAAQIKKTVAIVAPVRGICETMQTLAIELGIDKEEEEPRQEIRKGS